MTLFDKAGGATVQDGGGDSGEANIDALLTADLQRPSGNGAGDAAGDTPVAGEAEAPEQETTEQVDTGAETVDDTESGGEGDGEEFDESALGEQDTDFSTDAYARAAAHYSKRAGKTLDPNDPGDRWILREMMLRGQKIKAMNAEEETPEEETPAQPKAEETAPAAPAKPTVEQIKARVAEAKQYAKSQVVPEVAMDFTSSVMKPMVEAIWPGKGYGEKLQITPEIAGAFTEAMTAFGAMAIADALPAIIGAVPQAVVNGDPMMARVRDMAVRESAIDEILDARSKAGGPAYPDFEKLVESGEIKRQMASDELKNAVFDSKDPYKNLVAKLKFAYRLAKNQPVDVGALEKAGERGRQQAQERARRVAAGRLPPGSSRSGPGAPGGSKLLNDIVGGGGSRFSRLLAGNKNRA